MVDANEVYAGDDDTGSIIGIVMGVAVGLGLGLIGGFLLAPRAGQETRQLLKRKTTWLLMPSRKRYACLLQRGGSLREWLKQQRGDR